MRTRKLLSSELFLMDQPRMGSLNDCLEKGPNTTPHIFDILLKFRRYPIGIVADVEKAFHQIVVSPKDRNMLRFLWFDDIGKQNPQIIQYQFVIWYLG